MRRMLDPTKVGGIPSTIEFDNDGNRTADKDLKVNGKLKLQSLVSNTNPDGDITKELGKGGGKLTQETRELSLALNGGTYKVGDVRAWEGTVEPNLVSVYVNGGSDIVFTMGTAVFIVMTTLSKGTNKGYWGIKFVCIKEGTISTATSKEIKITTTSIA